MWIVKAYITRIWVPVEWGIEHPNTHDQDDTETSNKVDFFQTPYCHTDGRNIAIITYDDALTSQENLITYSNIKAGFGLDCVTEAEVNTILSTTYWLDGESNPFVSVSNFVFTDNRPIEL